LVQLVFHVADHVIEHVEDGEHAHERGHRQRERQHRQRQPRLMAENVVECLHRGQRQARDPHQVGQRPAAIGGLDPLVGHGFQNGDARGMVDGHDRGQHRDHQPQHNAQPQRQGRRGRALEDGVGERRGGQGSLPPQDDPQDGPRHGAHQPVEEGHPQVDAQNIRLGAPERFHRADLLALLGDHRADHVRHEEAGHDHGDDRQDHQHARELLHGDEQHVVLWIAQQVKDDVVGRALGDRLAERR